MRKPFLVHFHTMLLNGFQHVVIVKHLRGRRPIQAVDRIAGFVHAANNFPCTLKLRGTNVLRPFFMDTNTPFALSTLTSNCSARSIGPLICRVAAWFSALPAEYVRHHATFPHQWYTFFGLP